MIDNMVFYVERVDIIALATKQIGLMSADPGHAAYRKVFHVPLHAIHDCGADCLRIGFTCRYPRGNLHSLL